MKRNFLYMFLKENDLVDIISPSTPASIEELIKVKEFLTQIGLRARFYMEEELLLNQKPHHLFSVFAANKRFEQLRYALENSDSKAIWSIRGGYGSSDLIPLLSNLPKPSQNKIFIGFSDISAIAIFLQQNWDQKIIYGPMLTQLAFDKVDSNAKKTIIDTIFGKKNQFSYQLKNLSSEPKIDIEGLLVGGCLSVIAAQIGTINQLIFDDKILFLEDIDESGEKLDRYFTQLLQLMIASQSYPQAIIHGNYSQGFKDVQTIKNIDIALEKFIQKLQQNRLNIAVFREISNCLGHATNMLPLIIGAEAKIAKNILTQNSVCIF